MNWNEMQGLRHLKPTMEPLSVADAFALIGTEEGGRMYTEHLENRPFPHYETDPENPDLLIEIAEDGTRTRGHFLGREFCEVK